MSKCMMVLWGAFALGCGGSQSRGVEPSCCAPPEAETADLESGEQAQASPESGTERADCGHLGPNESTQADFEKGKYLVDSCDETCMKSLEGGKKREEGLALLKNAAEKGHLEAQGFYGRTKFTDLVTTGFEPSLEEEYVEAMYFLSLAARRGNTEAQSEMPQFETLSLKADGSFSEPLTEPLNHLDEEWVRAAVERAQTELGCFDE